MENLTQKHIDALREQWDGDLYPCTAEFHSLCEMAKNYAYLRKEDAPQPRVDCVYRVDGNVIGMLWGIGLDLAIKGFIVRDQTNELKGE